jgi:hypothetical protein
MVLGGAYDLPPLEIRIATLPAYGYGRSGCCFKLMRAILPIGGTLDEGTQSTATAAKGRGGTADVKLVSQKTAECGGCITAQNRGVWEPMDKVRALIVDDSSVMRKIVERSLRQAGVDLEKVTEAGNGGRSRGRVARENLSGNTYSSSSIHSALSIGILE